MTSTRIISLFALVVLVCSSRLSADINAGFDALPRFFFDGPIEDSIKPVEFSPTAYLSLAIELQGLGRDRALMHLSSWAKGPHAARVIPLCRMLFVPKDGRTFRAPALGAPGSLPRSDGGEWPLEPIAIVDGVPFLITIGYTLAGLPESGNQYLDYCESSCAWNPVRYSIKSDAQLAAAFEKLKLVAKGPGLDKLWSEFIRSQVKWPNHTVEPASPSRAGSP